MGNRFSDQHKTVADFHNEVWVVCPACSQKAIAKNNVEKRVARLQCLACGYQKEVSIEVLVFAYKGLNIAAAHRFFNASLWLEYPFKNHLFYAYNLSHLAYLEQYIAASLREHKDRTHFTLLEKLPKFYHAAKNRKALLGIIEKLKKKS